MPNIFDEYSKDEYIKWHNQTVDTQDELLQSLSDLMQGLKTNSTQCLITLGELLGFIRTMTKAEIKVQKFPALKDDFSLPSNALLKRNQQEHSALFKSEDSIVEKLWRKNKERKSKDYVGMSNISYEITDLIRTSVVCPSLFHARLYSQRLANWSEYGFKDKQNLLVRVEVDDEAKLASGYFAYHSLVYFKDLSTPVEVQIFSRLSSAWRDLSHMLYERKRLGESHSQIPGESSTRLVSLGHLLHLAECEIERLIVELR